MSAISPSMLVGQTIVGVCSSWYVTDGEPPTLLDAWIRFDRLGQVCCHACSGLELLWWPPPEPYTMPELGGSVTVLDMAPLALAELVGHEVVETQTLVVVPQGYETGLLLVTSGGSLALVDLADDLTIGDWADQERWHSVGVGLQA
jgi:hypothetical protein